MVMVMSSPSDKFRYVFVRQLCNFDQKLPEFRSIYESFTLDERNEVRESLVEVNALEQKCPFEWCLQVQAVQEIYDEHDEHDEHDEKMDERGAEFTALTMLMAIKCWDEGQPFAPETTYP